MKAVMLSIQPKWCELIASGEKTLEVSKTRPKMDTPFKCYIYQTKGKSSAPTWMDEDGHLDFVVCGAVIGEFVCKGIYRLFSVSTANRGVFRYDFISKTGENRTCLTMEEMVAYGKGKDLFCWDISDLRIYEQPKDIKEFIRPCTNDLYCEACAMYSEFDEECGNRALQISRPPQSWCYVEELEANDD